MFGGMFPFFNPGAMTPPTPDPMPSFSDPGQMGMEMDAGGAMDGGMMGGAGQIGPTGDPDLNPPPGVGPQGQPQQQGMANPHAAKAMKGMGAKPGSSAKSAGPQSKGVGGMLESGMVDTSQALIGSGPIGAQAQGSILPSDILNRHPSIFGR